MWVMIGVYHVCSEIEDFFPPVSFRLLPEVKIPE